ncbi:hypothetical protein BC832DRAFT_410855 [Gaertneriomyces semiglobifer]|nr:hypothetical protein BC832DRAFT_410855 [Gaertneriomyces semiglobifer]
MSGYPGYPPQPSYPPYGGQQPPAGYPAQPPYPQQQAYPPQQYPPVAGQGFPSGGQPGAYYPAPNYPPQGYPPSNVGAQPYAPYPPQQQAYPPPAQPPYAGYGQLPYPPGGQSYGPPMGQAYLPPQPYAPPGHNPSYLLSPHDAERCATQLRIAMKGFGTDEKTLISVLCNKTPDQCLQIVEAYRTHVKRELIRDLESETSSHFRSVLTLLCRPLAEVDAVCLKEAMAGVGTDEDALIEIIVGRTPEELMHIKNTYKSKYGKDLLTAVQSETSGYFKKLLTELLSPKSGAPIQHAMASDVDALYRAGVGKLGTDEATFIHILTNRTPQHLLAVFNGYNQKYGMTMSRVIEKEFSGDIKKGLLTFVKCIENRIQFIAEQFEKSMKGFGTKDDKLVRLTVRHREPAMMHSVKQAYLTMYGKTLYKRVEGETSGDYRKALLAIIGQ